MWREPHFRRPLPSASVFFREEVNAWSEIA
nr:MAG TPA: hypothetical protein [Caudoviricetes sp.]